MTLKLLLYTPNDFNLNELISWIPSQQALRQWAGPTVLTWPLDKTQLTAYLARTQGKEPESYIFKAIHNHKYIGHIEFDKINRTNKTTVLSRVLVAPEARDIGLGYQMIKTGLDFVFKELQFKEVTLTVYSFNTQAIRCYEKLGFEQIGKIEDQKKSPEENWDCHIMSILEEKWLAK